jgi:hypothetical protein
MSRKTLLSSNLSAIAPTAERLALRKIHVACATAFFALAPSFSAALELGNAALRSRLGEPLIVEVPYRLADGERLTPGCVGLVAAPHSAGALPSYARASRVAITPTHIRIVGDSRVLEPLIGVTVGVRCASTPNFARSYELFVDPPSYLPAMPPSETAVARAETRAPAARAAEPGAVAGTSAEAPRSPRAETPARARGQTGGTLKQGQTYVVVRGDTLTGIAARVGDRPGTIRAAADAVYAANPEAFTRGDQNLLQAGRAITIPLLTTATSEVPATAEPVATPAAADTPPAAPAVADTRPSAAAQPIVTELPPAPVAEVPAPRANVAPPVDSVPAAASSSGASGLGALWWALLSALAGAVASAVVVLWIVRRRQRPLPLEEPKPRTAHRRKLVDPTAGIDVVEGELPRIPAAASARQASGTAPLDVRAPIAPDFDPGSPQIGATCSVDLDVGMPTPVVDAVVDEGARTATLQQQTVDDPTAVLVEANGDDERHTLTVAELDILRADYEAEHTLTPESSEALRDALADLKASDADASPVARPQRHVVAAL